MNTKDVNRVARVFLDDEGDEKFHYIKHNPSRIDVLYALIQHPRFRSAYPRLQPLLRVFTENKLRSLFSNRMVLFKDQLEAAVTQSIKKASCELERCQREYAEHQKSLLVLENRISGLRREVCALQVARTRQKHRDSDFLN